MESGLYWKEENRIKMSVALKNLKEVPYSKEIADKYIPMLKELEFDDLTLADFAENDYAGLLPFIVLASSLFSTMFHSFFIGFSVWFAIFSLWTFYVYRNEYVFGHPFLKAYFKEQEQEKELASQKHINIECQKKEIFKNKVEEEMSELFFNEKPKKKEEIAENRLLKRINEKYIPELSIAFESLDKDIQNEKAEEFHRVMGLFSERIIDLTNVSKDEQRESFDRMLRLAEKKAAITS